MKLYYVPGACSLCPHIAAVEAGIDIELEMVDLSTGKTSNGEDFRKVNPKGYVPALRLDNGEVLTEGPIIVQYLADQVPERNLIPAMGSMERYRAQEWLSFITSELHKTFGSLFRQDLPDGERKLIMEKIAKRFEYVNDMLDGKQFLMGDSFTVADAYLFTILTWTKPSGIDIAQYPQIVAYMERVGARPTVQTAFKEEGLA
jgi:glutathione S-transferase